MAKVLTQRNIRHTNSADLDRQALDVTALRNGGVGVAFGGANRAGSGVTHTGLLDLATGRLGALTRSL